MVRELSRFGMLGFPGSKDSALHVLYDSRLHRQGERERERERESIRELSEQASAWTWLHSNYMPV